MAAPQLLPPEANNRVGRTMRNVRVFRIELCEGVKFCTQHKVYVSFQHRKEKASSQVINLDKRQFYQRLALLIDEGNVDPLIVKVKTKKFMHAKEVTSELYIDFAKLKAGETKDAWIDFTKQGHPGMKLHFKVNLNIESMPPRAIKKALRRIKSQVSVSVPLKTYHTGETISGVVHVSAPVPLKIKDGLRLLLFGYEYVFWQRSSGRNTVTYTRTLRFLNKEITIKGFPDGIPVGHHTIPFKIQIPQGLPSSFFHTGVERGEITYKIMSYFKPGKKPIGGCSPQIDIAEQMDEADYPDALNFTHKKSGVKFSVYYPRPVLYIDDNKVLEFTMTIENVTAKVLKLDALKLKVTRVFLSHTAATAKKYTMAEMKLEEKIEPGDTLKKKFKIPFQILSAMFWPTVGHPNIVRNNYRVKVKTRLGRSNANVSFPFQVCGHPRARQIKKNVHVEYKLEPEEESNDSSDSSYSVVSLRTSHSDFQQHETTPTGASTPLTQNDISESGDLDEDVDAPSSDEEDKDEDDSLSGDDGDDTESKDRLMKGSDNILMSDIFKKNPFLSNYPVYIQ